MRRVGYLIGVLTSIVLLAGCTSSTGEAEPQEKQPGTTVPSELPTTSSSPEEMEEFFNSHSWKDKEEVEEARDNWQGMVLYSNDEAVMVLFGSSSCPPSPRVIVEDSETKNGEVMVTKVTLEMEDYQDRACTADLGPHFTKVEETSQVSFSPDMTVVAKHPYSEDITKISAFYGVPFSETSSRDTK